MKCKKCKCNMNLISFNIGGMMSDEPNVAKVTFVCEKCLLYTQKTLREF